MRDRWRKMVGPEAGKIIGAKQKHQVEEGHKKVGLVPMPEHPGTTGVNYQGGRWHEMVGLIPVPVHRGTVIGTEHQGEV